MANVHDLGTGLSPHGRGKPRGDSLLRLARGSIPARAGETPRESCSSRCKWVYPRTGGGNPPRAPRRARSPGLSPHGRGKLGRPQSGLMWPGSIPARAGETANQGFVDQTRGVYPRTGGGNSDLPNPRTVPPGLSPHGRGKRVLEWFDRGHTGSIPARAGETGNLTRGLSPRRVYPRTGGGNRFGRPHLRQFPGLSPHGRGKLA